MLAARLDAMLAGGWPDEVRALDARVSAAAPAWNATGYSVVRSLARGEIGMADAREQILIATRQYAKRQRTWIRNQLAPGDVTRIDPRDRNALDRALAWWHDAPEGMG